MAIEIVDFPMKHGGYFYSCDSCVNVYQRVVEVQNHATSMGKTWGKPWGKLPKVNPDQGKPRYLATTKAFGVSQEWEEQDIP